MKHTPLSITTVCIAAVTLIVSADDRAVDAAAEPNANKLVDEWACPHGSGGGIGTIGIDDGPIKTSIINTQKPFGEVWSFYATKVGIDKEYSENTAYYDHGKTKDGRYIVRDVIEKGHARRTFFVYTCSRYTVTSLVKATDSGTVVDMTIVAHK